MKSTNPFADVLASSILRKTEEVRTWFLAQTLRAPPPFYCSVDLRDSGYKISSVDCNLYPAGFNNLCSIDRGNSPSIFRNEILRLSCARGIRPEKVLIIPENHTSNKNYISNIETLKSLIEKSGFQVMLGWYPNGEPCPNQLLNAQDQPVEIASLEKRDGKLIAQGPNGNFMPDLILLNNDFSVGFPSFLTDISQPVVPGYQLGWYRRKKSSHFDHYNRLAEDLGSLLGIDPWLIQTPSTLVEPIDFQLNEGMDRLIASAESIFNLTEKKLKEHKIEEKPFIFIKNNAGTYGIGIHVVRSLEELSHLNRRIRNKMSVGKGNQAIHSVIIQEGIPTAVLTENRFAEPVIYQVGTELLGGFLRSNEERGADDNLNSKGMKFHPLCVSDLKMLRALDVPCLNAQGEIAHKIEEVPALELAYGTVARLSAMAAGLEYQEAL